MMLFIIGGCKNEKIQIQIMLMQQLINRGSMNAIISTSKGDITIKLEFEKHR